MPELNWVMFAIVCPLCALAGFIDSIAGGGGVISLPAYYLAGLSPHFAAGTNKLSAGLGTIVSVIRYGRSGKLAVRPALLAVLGALPGAYLGALVLQKMDEALIQRLMLFILPAVCVLVITRRKGLKGTGIPAQWRDLVCFLIGLVIGFYDGLFGPGTGSFLIILFTMVLGMDTVTASGSAKLVNLASNVASLVSFLLGGFVIWALALPAALFAMAGNALGTKLAIRGGEKVIRWVLVLALLLILVRLIFQMTGLME